MELTSEEALQKGIEAQRAGQIQEADRLYTAILKAHPKHPDVNHNMGVLAVGVGKIQEALPFFKKAIESNGSIGQFWLSYINALMSLGLLSDAKAVLDQARDKGASGEAFDQLEQQLFGPSVNQQDPPSHQLLPIINLCIQGQSQEALSHATEMLEGFPNSAILYNISGVSYTGLMQFDSAIDSFNMALKIKPDYADACNNMGLALNNKGDPEAAIDSYIQALKIKPDYAEVYNNMGLALNDKGDSDAAINSYKQALKIKPDYADVHNNMGLALNNKGEPEAAVDSYNKAIKVKPDFAEAFNNRGIALNDMGNPKAAIDSYKKALKVNPDYAEVYNNMGVALKDEGDFEAALDSCKRALKIKPDYVDAYKNIGNFFQENCQYKQAKEYFDKLMDIDESVAKSLECTYHLENYGEFNKLLRSIAKKNPANIRVAAMSAFAAHQTKQKDSYPFCKNPLELVKFSHIKNHIPNANKFINTILDEMNSKNAPWEPRNKATKSGFQSSGNLFTEASVTIKLLETIIQKELSLFYSKYKFLNNTLIENWPGKCKLTGWYVRMLQNGHQNSHIHPSGWVSGVFYLKTVEAPAKNEGAIEFGLHGYNYPVKNKDYPHRIYQPCNGDIILFPSSLFHRTIPVIKNSERCVIAFDLVR